MNRICMHDVYYFAKSFIIHTLMIVDKNKTIFMRVVNVLQDFLQICINLYNNHCLLLHLNITHCLTSVEHVL